MRCSEQMPGQDRYCAQPDGHTGQHQDEFGEKWSLLGESVGFSREELAAAASRQQRKLTVFDTLPVAPSKEEILDTIRDALRGSNATFRDRARADAVTAVEKLFADRGL